MTYLAIAVDKAADRSSTIFSWDSSRKMEALRNTFGRQAIPMTWDFAEGNPFSASSGNWTNNVEWTAMTLDQANSTCSGNVSQADATAALAGESRGLLSTDPPYYDNIGYADLSDFFYVWLRRSLRNVYPELFATLLVPKSAELVATPYRFGGSRQKADDFFREGLGRAFQQMRSAQAPDYPLTIHYAFKQAEAAEGRGGAEASSTGWETMLTGMIEAGFAVTATWPMRSELGKQNLRRYEPPQQQRAGELPEEQSGKSMAKIGRPGKKACQGEIARVDGTG
jgi:putative DNA methylase